MLHTFTNSLCQNMLPKRQASHICVNAHLNYYTLKYHHLIIINIIIIVGVVVFFVIAGCRRCKMPKARWRPAAALARVLCSPVRPNEMIIFNVDMPHQTHTQLGAMHCAMAVHHCGLCAFRT